MNIKRYVSFFIGMSIVLSFSSFYTESVQAADNDNFSVTCSGAYLECNIINATWAIGTVAMSTSYWTNETVETETADVTNCTQGTNIDFEMTISANPADWKSIWVTNASTASDHYRINASDDSWVSEQGLENTTYHDVTPDHDPVADITFDLRFDSPTATTSGASQTITLNGKVTVH